MTTPFVSLINHLVQREGGITAFTRLVGSSDRAVREWRSGESIPYVATLLHLADRCQIPRDVVLHAAGKPSSLELRELLCTQPDATLAVQLDRYRSSHCLDTEAAAAVFGVNRWQFSRLANGSTVVRTLKLAGRISRGLGVSVVDVLRASGHPDDAPIVVTALEATSGFAGWVRTGIEREGNDSFAPAVVTDVATSAELSSERFKVMLLGQRLPDLREAQRIHRRFDFELEDVLNRAGWDERHARRIAHVARDAGRSRRGGQPLGELIRTYRKNAGMSGRDVAQRLGLSCGSTISRWESNEQKPGAGTLVQFADLTDAPLDRLLLAADLIV